MNTLKKIALAVLVAASFGAVSTTAFAETDSGRIVFSPTAAIDITAGKIQVALDALIAGGDAEAVSERRRVWQPCYLYPARIARRGNHVCRNSKVRQRIRRDIPVFNGDEETC